MIWHGPCLSSPVLREQSLTHALLHGRAQQHLSPRCLHRTSPTGQHAEAGWDKVWAREVTGWQVMGRAGSQKTVQGRRGWRGSDGGT